MSVAVWRLVVGMVVAGALASGAVAGQVGLSSGVSPSPVRYAMNFSTGDAGGFTQVAGATSYYATLYGVDPFGAEASLGQIMPFSGRIISAVTRMLIFGTNGANGQNFNLVVRNTTGATDSSVIATLDTDQDVTSQQTNTNIAFTSGDEIKIKLMAPVAWTTQPTVMFISTTLHIEVP